MLQRLTAAFCLTFLLSSQAFGWSATAYDRDSGNSNTVFDSDSPEAANESALKSCRERSRNADCHLTGKPVLGTTVVIAIGSNKSPDDKFFHVANPDPEKAANQALRDCAKSARICYLSLAVWDEGKSWGALAMSDAEVGLAYNAETKEEAERLALNRCEERSETKGKCRIQPKFTIDRRGWYVFASSDTYSGFGASTTSKKAAIDLAIESCRDGSKGAPCKVHEEYENKGATSAPASFKKLVERIEREKAQRLTKPVKLELPSADK